MKKEPKILEVGDEVTVREWDDLVAEYGINDLGGIRGIPFGFIESMKKYCGKTAHIVYIQTTTSSGMKLIKYYLGIDGGLEFGYTWSIEMFQGYGHTLDFMEQLKQRNLTEFNEELL